jgi:hypothetical protein
VATRGWMDAGTTRPPDPIREILDEQLMKHGVFKFSKAERLEAGQAMVDSLRTRLDVRVYALCVQSWHSHFVTSGCDHPIPQIVKCAKDAVRWKLRVGRPIWGSGYDKRFCFDRGSALNRIAYVERHNLEDGLDARPFTGLCDFAE